MLAETEVRRPGVYPVGTYRFLRPPPVLVQHEEVREMAANAIAELVTEDDTAILTRLEEVHEALERDMALDGEANRVKRLFATGLDDVVLPTLVTVGRRSRIELEMRVRAHEDEYEFDDAAHLRLRMKEFEEAVQLFERQTRIVRQFVIPSYNKACAYARWSEAEAAAGNLPVAARLREGAVSALSRSVENGYADWAWMEQDLDLKAIRETTGYREIVATLKRKFPPPATWRSATGGGAAPDAPPTDTRRAPPPPGTTPPPRPK